MDSKKCLNAVKEKIKVYIESLHKEIEERSNYMQEYGIDISNRRIIEYITLDERAKEEIENLRYILDIAAGKL